MITEKQNRPYICILVVSAPSVVNSCLCGENFSEDAELEILLRVFLISDVNSFSSLLQLQLLCYFVRSNCRSPSFSILCRIVADGDARQVFRLGSSISRSGPLFFV
jgi:hypothetical protein